MERFVLPAESCVLHQVQDVYCGPEEIVSPNTEMSPWISTQRRQEDIYWVSISYS